MSRVHKGLGFSILGLLLILLLAAVAFPFSPFRRSSTTVQKSSEANKRQHKREKTPPEDSFLAQRVIHGGIPAGALEKARAQATRVRTASRPSATGQLSPQVTTTPWQFIGPTN